MKLVKERGVAVRQAAADLGLHEKALRRWVRNLEAHREQAFPGQGTMRSDDAEVARLRRELAKTEAERDFSSKAIARACGVICALGANAVADIRSHA